MLSELLGSNWTIVIIADTPCSLPPARERGNEVALFLTQFVLASGLPPFARSRQGDLDMRCAEVAILGLTASLLGGCRAGIVDEAGNQDVDAEAAQAAADAAPS